MITVESALTDLVSFLNENEDEGNIRDIKRYDELMEQAEEALKYGDS